VRSRLELLIPAFLVVAFVGVAVLDVAAFPYHDWDALSYGEWSRLIGEHWRLDFPSITDQTYQRPLLYVAQGVAWGVLGFSERLGRIVDLTFGLLLLGALFELGRRLGSRALGATAAVLTLLIPTFQAAVASGLTDVPAAAMVALTGLAVVVGYPILIAVASCVTVLTKPSTLPSLLGLGLAFAIGPRTALGPAVRRTGIPLAAGVVAALAYDAYQAAHVHDGLIAFLRAGSTGYYAALASQMRRSALFGTDWLGGLLRTLLIFALVYACLRAAKLSHVRASCLAFVVAAVGAYVGPLVATHGAHAGVGPFDSWRHALGYVVVLAMLTATFTTPADRVPAMTLLRRLLIWALPPVVAWVWSGGYDVRLVSPAWPPLILLCAVIVRAAFDGASGRRVLLVLPAAAALCVAVAAGLENIDGIGHSGWRAVQHSPSGFFDLEANRHTLLPQFQDALLAVRPVLGEDGLLFSSDGKFRFFFPGRVTQSYPRTCASLRGYRVFVLLTDEASASYMQSQLHVSPDPSFWAACRGPQLTELMHADSLTAFRVH
jgi:hypothetical protein